MLIVSTLFQMVMRTRKRPPTGAEVFARVCKAAPFALAHRNGAQAPLRAHALRLGREQQAQEGKQE